MHGGRAPQVVAAAQRRMEAAAAAEAVVMLGLPREVDPQQALVEEVHRTAGHVEWLAAKIASLPEDDLSQRDPTGWFERPSVWLELYQAERAHLVRVAKACVDAGVAEYEVRLAEEQGRQLASVLQNVLADVFVALEDAGLPVEILARAQREEVPAVIRRRLMPLASGCAETGGLVRR